mgnify:CR=1 FL=1
MSEHAFKLPDLVRLEAFGGDVSRYIEEVYRLFRRDFIASTPMLDGLRVSVRRYLDNGKEATFWHVTSEGAMEAARTPDLRRCERIRWLRPMIEAADAGVLPRWRNARRAGEERVLIALADFSHLVVLAVRSGYYLLWTAYPIEYDNRRRRLEQEYRAYRAGKG